MRGRLRCHLAHPPAAGVRARAGRNGGRAGQPEGLRPSCCGAWRPERRSPRPTGGARWASGGSAPFPSHQENRQGRARRLRHVVRVPRRSRVGAGRLRPNLHTSLHQVRRDSAMAQLLTVREVAIQLAGFAVERLQDARGRCVPASTGSTAQRQSPLAAGGRRRLGRSAQMRRRAPRTLSCPGGGRGRAVAQLPTVREVAIQWPVSRPTVQKMSTAACSRGSRRQDRSTTCLHGVTARQRRHAVRCSKPAAAPMLFAGGPRLRRSDTWKIRTTRCTTLTPRSTSEGATRSGRSVALSAYWYERVRQVATSSNLKPGVILRNAIKLGLVQLEKQARPGDKGTRTP